MTSDRAYRRGMTPADAFAELRKGSGTQWDAQLVAVFIDLIKREGEELRVSSSRRAQLTLTDLLQPSC
jgi:HD-GYP domain-containing protein (c-di-GMP phosphodiesterase class II)